MNKIQFRFLRLFSIVALLTCFGLELSANVKLYRSSNFKGEVLIMNIGEYNTRKFSRHLSRSTYCSIKVPSGYCIDVDYAGMGWNNNKVRSYPGSVSRLKTGFKKIRIRKCSAEKPSKRPDVKENGPACGRNWTIQFYQRTGYNGQLACFPSGYHRVNTRFGVPKSIKVRSGYEVELYLRKRLIKKLSGTISSLSYQFDAFQVKRKTTTRPGNGAGTCSQNWAVQFYKDPSYKGAYHCYSTGEHVYRSPFKTAPRSFRVKAGYEVLIMYKGRVVSKITRSISNYRKRFDKIKVVPQTISRR